MGLKPLFVWINLIAKYIVPLVVAETTFLY